MIAAVFRSAIVVPIVGMVILAQIFDKPWLLWAVPLGLFALVIVAMGVIITWQSNKDVREQRADDARFASLGAAHALTPEQDSKFDVCAPSAPVHKLLRR